MGKLIDLTGQKFGKLTIIRREHPNGKSNKIRWLCRCECGEETIVNGGDIKNGHTRSCGCLQKAHMKNIGDLNKLRLGLGSMRLLIRNYKNGAKKRGLKYNLTEKQFEEITKKDCFYCGKKPNQLNRGHRKYPPFGDYIYNGLDRVDNTKGYVIDNVVPCCKTCNSAKGILTLKEYKEWLKKAYNKMFDR